MKLRSQERLKDVQLRVTINEKIAGLLRLTGAPPAGLSPPDTLGVQSVAVCMELFGCDVGAPVEDGAAEGLALVDLLPLLRPITTITTSAMTPSTATPARINQGTFERGPRGGGPGGYGQPCQPGGNCWPGPCC